MLPVLLLAVAAQDPLQVLEDDAYVPPYQFLVEEARQLREHHAALAARSRTPHGARARQAAKRVTYEALLGPLPERTPLETTVVGVLQADGYRVERLHFQSRPGHHVTANLYVPEGPGPFPGVAVPCGHSSNGKATESYQRACALLATNGLMALIYDPVGQGERHQIDLDRHGTTEHELTNAAGLLLGEPLAKHELWDGMRAIDVLLERGATKIGVAGNSGGGTQTVFLTAFDERVAAATPSCYVMEHLRLFETIGPQDGCQWIPGEGAHGLDHADYLALFAPKPMRVLAAEQDFFEFASTRRAVQKASRTWVALGASERIDLVSTDDRHGWSRPLREGCASWMTRWLLEREAPVVEGDLTLFTDAELQVTETGQVRSAFEGERTLVDLWHERLGELRGARPALTRQLVDAAIGCRKEFIFDQEAGLRELDGVRLIRHEVRWYGEDGGAPMPALELRPGLNATGALTVVLHEDGKAADLDLLLERARAGQRVFAIDLWGFGELEDRDVGGKYRNPDHRLAVLALHNGGSLLGRRVGQFLSWLDLIAQGRDDVELIAIGRTGVTALHAAFLESYRFPRVELRGTLGTWEEVLADPAAPGRLGNVVPGVLALYDLPDLEAALGEKVVRTAR